MNCSGQLSLVLQEAPRKGLEDHRGKESLCQASLCRAVRRWLYEMISASLDFFVSVFFLNISLKGI